MGGARRSSELRQPESQSTAAAPTGNANQRGGAEGQRPLRKRGHRQRPMHNAQCSKRRNCPATSWAAHVGRACSGGRKVKAPWRRSGDEQARGTHKCSSHTKRRKGATRNASRAQDKMYAGIYAGQYIQVQAARRQHGGHTSEEPAQIRHKVTTAGPMGSGQSKGSQRCANGTRGHRMCKPHEVVKQRHPTRVGPMMTHERSCGGRWLKNAECSAEGRATGAESRQTERVSVTPVDQ